MRSFIFYITHKCYETDKIKMFEICGEPDKYVVYCRVIPIITITRIHDLQCVTSSLYSRVLVSCFCLPMKPLKVGCRFNVLFQPLDTKLVRLGTETRMLAVYTVSISYKYSWKLNIWLETFSNRGTESAVKHGHFCVLWTLD